MTWLVMEGMEKRYALLLYSNSISDVMNQMVWSWFWMDG